VKSQRCALVQRGTDFMITVISYSFYTYRRLAWYRPVSPYANVDLYYRLQKTHRLAWKKHRHQNRVYNNLPFLGRNSRSRRRYLSFFLLFIKNHSSNDYNFRDGTFNFKQFTGLGVIRNSKYLYYHDTKCLLALASWAVSYHTH